MSEQLETIQQESIQALARGEDSGAASFSVLSWFAQAGETIAPWWSTQRDRQLRDFSKKSDHWSGAMSTMAGKIAAIPFHVEPRDPSIKLHMRQADEYEKRLYELSEFGQGYDTWIVKTLQAFGQQDNGYFTEIIGDGDKDGPIVGPALALASLDPARCTRTGNPEFPVTYRDTDGKAYKLHYTRVAFRASMPSDRAEMYGVGLCPLSRAINTVQHLVDIATYEQEKLGSRPKRGILLMGGGLDPEDMKSAVRLADSTMDGRSLARYGQLVAMGSRNISEPTIDLVDLASIPDGFDKQTSLTLGMYAIALAWNIPPRWIWPATATGATKADAMFSHIAGQGAGVGSILNMFTLMLGGSPEGPTHMIGKFLPPHLKLVYDFVDDEQDKQKAEIKSTRAKTRQVDLEAGVTDIQVSRQQALDVGDLTDRQYIRLELEDGRLPDGGDVLSLFSSTEDIYLRLLDVGVPDPLALDINDPFQMLVEIDAAALDAQDVLVNARNAKQREQAEQAIAALNKLKEAYSEIVTQMLQAQVTEELTGQTPEEQQEQETPEQQAEQEQPPEEMPEEEKEIVQRFASKGFNFGARMGEVIGGNLARGAGGRFVSASQIRSGMLSALLERLRGKREGGELSAAEKKRLANRENVVAKLGDRLAAGTIDGLASLRNGDMPDNASSLVERGFAKRNADGTITMTSRGRTLMNAANSGDVDRARTALEEKPKRGGGGGGGKSEEEREQERLQEIADNRAKVAASLDEDLREDFGALGAFADGADLSAEAGARLASAGLVEFDEDGQPRLTSAGRRAINAASRGDSRTAQDAISVGRERAQKIQDSIDGLDDQIDAIESQFAELDAAGATMDEEDATRLRARLEQLKARREEQARKLARKEVVPPLPFWLKMILKQHTYDGYLAYWRDKIHQIYRARDLPPLRFGLERVPQFRWTDQAQRSIRTFLEAAWDKGAEEFGIRRSEYTTEERAALERVLSSQSRRDWINDFYDAIADAHDRGLPEGSLDYRARMWANRWNDIFNRAKAIFGKNRKLKWVINYTRTVEHNCRTCLRLNGKIKRSSQWDNAGIYPQNGPNPRLECEGWQCGCGLVPTDEPMSKGPLPKTP